MSSRASHMCRLDRSRRLMTTSLLPTTTFIYLLIILPSYTSTTLLHFDHPPILRLPSYTSTTLLHYDYPPTRRPSDSTALLLDDTPTRRPRYEHLPISYSRYYTYLTCLAQPGVHFVHTCSISSRPATQTPPHLSRPLTLCALIQDPCLP